MASRPSTLFKKSVLSLNDFNERYLQTTWFLSLSCLGLYFLVSCLAGTLWFEFKPLDTIYWSVITLATVGYGDFYPTEKSQRLFTAFMILVGVGVGSSLVTALNNRIYEHNQLMSEQRNMRTNERLAMLIENPVAKRNKSVMSIRSGISGIRVDIPINDGDCGDGGVEEGGRRSLLSRSESTHSLYIHPSLSLTTLKKLYQDTYMEDRQRLRSGFIINAAIIISIVSIGALGICIMEGWDAELAVYWSIVTLSTVGYGDLTPSTRRGKFFTTIFVLTSCAFLSKTVSELVQFPLLWRSKKNEQKFFQQFSGGLSKEKLKSIFESNFLDMLPGMQQDKKQFNKSEFAILVLNMLNKIDTKDLLMISYLFDSMDADMNGVLTEDEMQGEVEAAKSEMQIEEEKNEEVVNTVRRSIDGWSSALSSLRPSPRNSQDSRSDVGDQTPTFSLLRSFSVHEANMSSNGLEDHIV